MDQASAAHTSARAHIAWAGPQYINQSLALVNRELELALIESRQVDLSIFPVGRDDESFADRLDPRFKLLSAYYGRRSSAPVDIAIRHQFPPNALAPREGRWVMIQPWEFGSLPLTWVQKINAEVDEVWVPSHYVEAQFTQSGVDPARVQVIPNGVDINFFKPGIAPYPIPSPKTFKFLFVGGTLYRKGVDILLQAYQRSFNAEDDVMLVIKDVQIYQGQDSADRIHEFQRTPATPSIYYLNQDLGDHEIVQLYNACDCVVLPYRGEGFALPALEAMACGLPVIVTAGGPTDDFVDDATGYRIPARKQTFGNRQILGLKTAGDLWMLEPDVYALAQTLTHIFQHRQEAQHKGAQALQNAARWTWKHAAGRVLERIASIHSQPIVRLQ